MPIVSVETFTETQFDYLVIGGGTSGLTVAARLSEAQNVTVGVIEAGAYNVNVPEIDVPGFIGRTIANPLYDWTFLSVPQARLGGRPVLQPRGKGLGGSSANNFLGMFRPAKEELDALEGLGNKGWNWPSLLEYMKKSETAYPSKLLTSSEEKILAAKPEPEYHGTSGPIKKAYPTYWTATQPLLFDTAEALGVSRKPEMGNGTNVGSMSSFHSVDPDTATRSYAASAYYAPNANRPNLLVLVNAQVTKITLEKSEHGKQKATGVELVIGGTKHSIKGVKKDLILSAGSFQTPQLLELSGIGNPSILKKHGIEPVVDLPGVGENLQDHVCVPSILEIDPKYETLDVLGIPEELEKHLGLYKEQKGLLSSCPAPGFLFLSSQHLGSTDHFKALQGKITVQTDGYVESVESLAIQNGLKKQYHLLKGWFQKNNLAQAEILNVIGHQPLPEPLPVPGKRYTTLVSALMHPLSRGTVHIGSSDPLAPPLIDPNYFAIESDLELLVDILTFTTTKLAKTPPFSDIVRSYVLPRPEVMQGPEEGLRDRLREYIRRFVSPVYHPVGTAAMLPLSDGGVVDSELKVYGTANLRVVDVSILPLELSGHIQSLAYAIGEKAADIFSEA